MTVKKTSVLVLDCAEPQALALFYAQLLDADVRTGDTPDIVEVVGAAGVQLAVRRDHGYAPPSWPRPEDSQQAHLRILVDAADLDEAEREAVSLGARPMATDVEDGPHDARLFSDPAGHSFTLAGRPAIPGVPTR
ncbi:VOC family protein [Streptomyces sp. NPDC054904]|uniref:VOC family protein n=1 Tax=unclassified Streptomyces TaxID=2593676 RepID=UPI002481C664|nr:VOC family protein [Streptomyces sp. Isolate_45]MDA5282582.1 VOC family protein [Streptomyces sp. Isolate_45]